MDTSRLLDQLLSSGRKLASRGVDMAADHFGVDDDPESRATLGKGALGGALAAGALTLLLGTRGGRRAGGAALKLGALAGLGALAYNALQKYSGSDAPDGQTVDELEGPAREARSRALLSALISAAKVDGHIDDNEREVIATRMRGLDDVDMGFVEAALAGPSDAEAIARMSDSDQASREVYAVSAFMTDDADQNERRYLDDLAKALGMDRDMARKIDDEVRKA